MKMQYLESLQAFVTTEIRIWDPSQPTNMYLSQYDMCVEMSLSFISSEEALAC